MPIISAIPNVLTAGNDVTASQLNANFQHIVDQVNTNAGSTGVSTNDLPFLVGQVNFFAMSSAPAGFLKCSGQAVSRTTYAALFTAIGTLYGVGDGSTTFNLPDLRGEFIRGLDDGRGVDSGRVIGSRQNDELRAHAHMIPEYSTNPLPHDSSLDSDRSVMTTATRSSGSTGGVETRPRNVALLACIFAGVNQ